MCITAPIPDGHAGLYLKLVKKPLDEASKQLECEASTEASDLSCADALSEHDVSPQAGGEVTRGISSASAETDEPTDEIDAVACDEAERESEPVSRCGSEVFEEKLHYLKSVIGEVHLRGLERAIQQQRAPPPPEAEQEKRCGPEELERHLVQLKAALRRIQGLSAAQEETSVANPRVSRLRRAWELRACRRRQADWERLKILDDTLAEVKALFKLRFGCNADDDSEEESQDEPVISSRATECVLEADGMRRDLHGMRWDTEGTQWTVTYGTGRLGRMKQRLDDLKLMLLHERLEEERHRCAGPEEEDSDEPHRHANEHEWTKLYVYGSRPFAGLGPLFGIHWEHHGVL